MSTIDFMKKDESTVVPIEGLRVDVGGTPNGSVIEPNGPCPRFRLYYCKPFNVFWFSMNFFMVGSSMFVAAGAMNVWALETTKFDVYAATTWLGFLGICLYQTGCWCGVMDVVNQDRKEPGWKQTDHKWFGVDLTNWNWWGWALFFFGTPFFVFPNFLVLPGVMPADFDYEANWVQWDLMYWTLLTIGGIFFVSGSTCSFIGAQDGKFWNPKVTDLTWWATLLYDIGSVGFTVSAVFGFFAYTGPNGFVCCQKYGTNMSYFWGSILFLIASYLLFIDTLHKDEVRAWQKGYIV